MIVEEGGQICAVYYMQITWYFLDSTSKDYAQFINVITYTKNYQNIMNKLKMLSIQ